jgi:hypothetical protein
MKTAMSTVPHTSKLDAALDAAEDADARGAPGRWRLWVAPAVSAIPVLVIGITSIMSFEQVDSLSNAFAAPRPRLTPLGVVELICVVLYVLPRTSTLGAVLLSGFLGGAIATDLHAGWASLIAPLVLGLLVWTGLYLRDERIRALLPFVKSPET